MQTAGLIFLVSLGVFLLWGLLVYIENRKGNRVILGKVRSVLDRAISLIFNYIYTTCQFVSRRIIKLGWYYFVHVGLKSLLWVVVTIYDWLERKFHHNRLQARLLRKTSGLSNKKSMLSEVAEHKVTTALTETEKKRLRKKSLE